MTTITALPTPPSRDDPANFATRADAFLGALPDFATETNTVASEVNSNASTASTAASTATTQAGNASTSASTATTKASEANASAIAAAASEASAAIYAAALKGTSTTSLAIGTGSKTFTTQSGKQWAAGQFIVAVDSANSANYMHGQVTSYATTSLVLDVQSVGGSGTIASWNIYVAGNRGATGAAGTGDVTGPGSSTSGNLASFNGTGGKTLQDSGVAAASVAQIGKQTIWIPSGAMTARTTNGAASGTAETTTNKVMLKTLDFDQTTDEFAQFSVRMPKSWNEGTVTAYFLWSSAVSGTNSVVWGIQAVALSDDDALDTAFGTAQTVTDAQTAQGDLMQSAETSAVTIAGTPAVGDWVVFQVYRDADNGSDNLAGDARLHGVVVVYTTDAANDA